MTAPYTAAELATILATHARFEMCKPLDCWRDAAYQLAEEVPRLVAELTRAREALRPFVERFERQREAYLILGNKFDAMPDRFPVALDVTLGDCRRARAALAAREVEMAIVSRELGEQLWAAAMKAKEQRAIDMPDDHAALLALGHAHQRLEDLGWRDAIYCPKDGTVFEVIEAGSTGIHDCRYEGEWPKGSWWVLAEGDLWPSRPILFRLKSPPV